MATSEFSCAIGSLSAARSKEPDSLRENARGRDTTKFLQVRHAQVSRILAQSPRTGLLLYDYNPVIVLDDGDSVGDHWDLGPGSFRSRGPTAGRSSHALTLPLSLAAATSQFDDTLYRFCYSFSHQICRRYLSLHDLDFSESAITAVKEFPAELGGTNHLLVIRAASIGQELPEECRPTENLYGVAE